MHWAFRMFYFTPLALSVTALVAQAAHADAWTTSGLVEGKKGKPAEDMSGIACAPEVDGARRCLVVDDETQFAQWVTLRDQTITAGALLPLIDDRFDDDPVELDGEGAAFADGAYYVIGSFGAPRTGAPDPESQARIEADSHLFRIIPSEGAAGQTVNDATTLRALLLSDADLGPFADHALDENGLTVEGVAVLGDTAFVGFRGPVLGEAEDRAAVLPLPLAALFEGDAVPTDAKVRQLPLGTGKGVRDLAAIGDELVVLAGPIGDEDRDHLAEGAYRLFRWNPQTDALREIFVVPTSTRTNSDGEIKPNKAEAILPIGMDDGQVEMLVIFDGPRNGAPTSYSFAW